MTQIITDSASALPMLGHIPRNVHILGMSAVIGDREYIDTKAEAFNAILKDNSKAPSKISTSQPSPAYINALFDDCLRTGEDLLAIVMSSKMSGTYDACCNVAADLSKRYPAQKIAVVDTTSNSLDEGLAALAAAEAIALGASFQEAIEAAIDSVKRSRWLFTTETLSYLRAGGRIGRASSLAADILKICPVLTVSNGETSVAGKIRHYRKARAFNAKKVASDAKKHGLESIYVQFAGDEDAARAWAKELGQELSLEIPVVSAAPAVGAHVGNASGIVYRCEEPVKDKVPEDYPFVEVFNG